MKITVLTLFPEMVAPFFTNSIVARAVAKGIFEYEIVNIRDYTEDKYGRVDTPPIGGGAGLIMKAQPIVSALDAIASPTSHKILLGPHGTTFSQQKAHQLTNEEHLVLICGHYEGVDQRVKNFIDEEISIGDYILTGGEIGAITISDAVIRLLDGAIKSESIADESFEHGLLEYPQYTEPYEFKGLTVPQILYTGNHTAINKWRKQQSLLETREKRPDLFAIYALSKIDRQLLHDADTNTESKWLIEALAKAKKFTKDDK